MKSDSSIDWDALLHAPIGQLNILSIPQSHWSDLDSRERTLLHYACFKGDERATAMLLASGLVDVNQRGCDRFGDKHTAAWMAVERRHHRVLELLCAAGADVRIGDPFGYALITERADCQRVLVANGVRLGLVPLNYRYSITPELKALERGVLRCRSAVATMMRVKKEAKLVRWDKFLLREIAFAVWATRYEIQK